MPHIHLETTADLAENVQLPDILDALVGALCRFETVSPPLVKAYHTLRSNWCMGSGAPPGFAHLSVAILAGRPIELRRSIADGMWSALREQFRASLAAGEVSLTLEVREMDPETYRK